MAVVETWLMALDEAVFGREMRHLGGEVKVRRQPSGNAAWCTKDHKTDGLRGARRTMPCVRGVRPDLRPGCVTLVSVTRYPVIDGFDVVEKTFFVQTVREERLANERLFFCALHL